MWKDNKNLNCIYVEKQESRNKYRINNDSRKNRNVGVEV